MTKVINKPVYVALCINYWHRPSPSEHEEVGVKVFETRAEAKQAFDKWRKKYARANLYIIPTKIRKQKKTNEKSN